ncbi:hypothetical protein [Maridesulfovibrio salexigens]|uniref:Lipoprotein n=1 Tax=Maridesulfovibrio salexigens (strain ATCC 14822 / DSM 2638 / NCIMB 8403 / VKM B-1763) TaxID=526222 RepID=C6BYY3_MARSD|nr:hypothetical protein [Maridesulfovibrio salexigens]ACS78807.1 conserved hypothetical protein [Maridesulfovibrio salexigens DSM 2638]
MKKLFLICILSLVTLTGCAVGNKYDLASAVPEVSHSSNKEVALGVQDARAYVIDGDKTQDFIGLQRGGFGNPFDVTTLSGKPLAEDILNAIAAGMEKQGYKVSKVTIPALSKAETAISKLSAEKKSRSMLVSILNWKSDTMYSVAMHYDFRATVYNESGKKLAETTLQGEDELGGSMVNPPAHAMKVVPQALEEQLTKIINSPAITDALSKN